ncbi:PREDICTED: heat shock factor-binding protein 1-like isoform X1 [Branchiostoma belcheri]|uniref:Heat shock factor-binding protein 1 n=1 Tax=Branchiostoma belcheri TaxID=7741 RepID=A0A6P4Z5C7_BRABE|nr:PREDICTED: heat shock factor-binding protein 1-like isoform X1 [Branchiostoma belcheri]
MKGENMDAGLKVHSKEVETLDPHNVIESTEVVQALLQQMQDKFQAMSDQIISRIDDMGGRIDELEKSIADLMTQAGVEEADK